MVLYTVISCESNDERSDVTGKLPATIKNIFVSGVNEVVCHVSKRPYYLADCGNVEVDP